MPLQIAPGMMVGVADNEHPNHPVPYDPEQQRQFEQFQQYQQFLKFQESQGQLPPGAVPPPPQAPKGRPWWKKVLRSKLFQKLVFLVLVLIGLTWAYNYYFGPAPDDNTVQGGAGPGTQDEPGRRVENPAVGMMTLYEFVAAGDKNACTLFEKSAAQAFAVDLGAQDCVSAVAALKGTVDGNLERPDVKWRGLQTVTVSSCTDIRAKPGTKLLGSFVFTNKGNGWTITDHARESDPCVAATTTTVPTTTPSR
jgi:hypothetical protein